MQNSPTYDEEQTKTQCEHCGDPVDINSTDIFKSVSDRFYHKDCFAEHCFERRELVATPEGSFEILPVVIKEIENGKESVTDSFWRAECPVCHRTHETDERSEDERTDLIDTVTSCCDTEWLPPADWIEDCKICGTSHRESRDCKPLSRREPFPDPDEHTYECSECGWSGESDEFDNPDGYCPECESAAVRALKLATDGGREVKNSPTDDGDGGVSREELFELAADLVHARVEDDLANSGHDPDQVPYDTDRALEASELLAKMAEGDGDRQYDNWFEMFQATVNRFEEENDDLEATLAGDVGFHSYFVADGDDPTRGSHTAIYQAVHETLDGVSVDAETVEMRRGKVTPETVSEEMMAQIDEFTYIPGELRDAIGEKVQKRVRKNKKVSADV